MNATIINTINRIAPADREQMALAEAHQSTLAKPPQSLGELENISIRIAGMVGHQNYRTDKRRVLVFASDNGVVAEGVASAPQSVTLMQTMNISRGMTGVGVIARHFHADIEVTDVGVYTDVPLKSVRNEKIAYATRNLAIEPAMTREQAEKAVIIGINAAERAKAEGFEIVGIGEMGIGNTTTSAAVLSALTGLPAEQTVSRGGGVNDTGFERKKSIVDSAIVLHNVDMNDPIDILSKVGGFDLCAMTGAFIGAAACRLPVVIDGFISAVAALCAVRLAPNVADYLIPSHASMEQGYRHAMEAIGLHPILNLGMRLGEGSGCPIAFEIVSAALTVFHEMATFEQAAINDEYLEEIRSEERFRSGK